MCAPKASFPPRTTTTTTTTNNNNNNNNNAAAAATTTTPSNQQKRFQLLLKVLVVARAIFKRLNLGAAVDGAEGVLAVRRHLQAPEPTQRLPLGDT